jgi:hypothetical protein
MFSRRHSIRLAGAALALLLLALAPAHAQAEVIVLRNDSQTPVQVQVVAVFKGRITQTPSVLLNPRMTLPGITITGDKTIILYDARIPTRMLFKGTIQASPINQSYSIQPDLIPPRLKLVPINPGP